MGEGGVYTIGVKSLDGANKNDKKGYGITQDLVEIMRIGNNAFEKCCYNRTNWFEYPREPGMFNKSYIVKTKAMNKNISNVLIFKTKDPENTDHYGLLTIYPDATPDNAIGICEIND